MQDASWSRRQRIVTSFPFSAVDTPRDTLSARSLRPGCCCRTTGGTRDNARRPPTTTPQARTRDEVDVFDDIATASLAFVSAHHKVTSRKLRLSTAANCHRECYSTVKRLIIRLTRTAENRIIYRARGPSSEKNDSHISLSLSLRFQDE